MEGRAVQAMCDGSGSVGGTSSGSRRQHVITSAYICLRSAREDFRTMVGLAAIDPNVQRKTVLKVLERGGNRSQRIESIN
jgi:hypothetical protein